MPQPTPYDRLTNFQNDQALAPVDPYPAPKIDQEYNAIKITIDEILQNLALIQRDDGQLANDSVGFDQIKDEVLVGFGPPEPWETTHHYLVGNTVFEDDGFYLCIVEHTSGVFADDLAAGKWSLIVDFAAVTDEANAAAAAAAASAAEAEASAIAAAESAADSAAAQGAFRWNYDSDTTMSDPGVGDVRGNGSPISTVTQLALSAQTADAGNPNILTWILTWDDSTSPIHGTIFIRKVADPEIFVVFNLFGNVVNNSSWAQIGVSYVTHSGALVNGEPVSVAFMRTGNQGVNGPGTGDMLGANNLTDVASPSESLANLGGVSKVGGVMVGDLEIEKEFPALILDSTTGSHSVIFHKDHGITHWEYGEADLGNHFFMLRHNAAGVGIDQPLYINWATGTSNFYTHLCLGVGDEVAPGGQGNADGASLFFGPQPAGHRIYYTAVDNSFRASGAVVADGKLVVGNIGANPALYFGPVADTRVLYWDTTKNNFTFSHPSGSGLEVTGDLRTWRTALQSTGAVFFGATGSGARYLFHDGTNFSFVSPVTTGSIYMGSVAFGGSAPSGWALNGVVTELRGIGNNNIHVAVQSGAGYMASFYYGGSTLYGNVDLPAGGEPFKIPNGSIRVGGYIVCDQGYKSGGGVWLDASDARIKTVVGTYDHGLEEVLALQPKRFTYKGNEIVAVVTPPPVSPAAGSYPGDEPLKSLEPPTSRHKSAAESGKEYIGLIAQEVETTMPEMVSQIAGTIDGQPVTDLRMLDTTALIYALVNSVKTLNARIVALETAAAPPP